MTLALYTAQVLALAFAQHVLLAGLPTRGWLVFLAVAIGSALLAVTWNRLAATSRWGRGPIEGLVGRASGSGGERRRRLQRAR